MEMKHAHMLEGKEKKRNTRLCKVFHKGEKYLWVPLTLMLLASMAMANVPVQASPIVRIYVDMPLGYIPGVPPGPPPGGLVFVDLYIDTDIPDNTPLGIVQWAISVQVDPAVLEPMGVQGAAAGYFLNDFLARYGYNFIGYSASLLPPAIDKGAGTMQWITEGIVGSPPIPNGAGAVPGQMPYKLCTLVFNSLSETGYSPIDLFYEVGVDAWYWTVESELAAIPVDVVEDGYYNQPRVHSLTVESTPIDGINFTLDATTYTTNVTVELEEMSYTITMPFTWLVGSDRYVFSHWEDNSTGLLRILNLTANMTIMATYELAKEYSLTVNSEPVTGINFKVDGTTYTTPWSDLLMEGEYTVTMPSTWMLGSDKYHFVKWEDNSTNRVRVISLTSNVTITASYLPVHSLTVESTPIDGIDFTIDMAGYTTNATVELKENSYIVTMPSTWMVGPEQYNFVEWEDASTDPSRVVSLTSNMTIVSTYALVPATVALISDHSELMYIRYILDSMSIGYDVYNDNAIHLYTEDAGLLLDYQAVIFYTDYRHITSNEYSALESYLSSGGNLLVTGFDCLVDDSLLADLVRSSSYGDNMGEPDLYVVDATHPIMNGPYGNFSIGYHISGLYSDCDRTEADTARNAVTVAELADGYDRIIATEELPGKVVFWNGRGDHDWRWDMDCETLFKNTLAWFTIRYEHELAVSLEAPDFLEPGQPCMLNATVQNHGLNNETNVDLFLLIDGTIVSDATIPELPTEESYTIHYGWTPMVEATYNVTAYAPPVPDENVTANNIATKMVIATSVRYILFDQTHGADSITRYSVWVANLTEKGYIVDTLTTSPITLSMLEGYDVFVIPQALNYYSSNELLAIQNFVLNGGGLLVIGDDAPYIYTDLTSFVGISWTSGGTYGITTDITLHEVTEGVDSVYLDAPIAQMLVTTPALDLVRDSAGGIMLAVSEQVGRVIGFVDESSLWDYGITQADNLRLANNMINWLRGVKYEHELVVRLDAPSFLEPGDLSLLNATVYNRGLSNETDVELLLLINGIEVESVVIPELPSGSHFTLSHIWAPILEGIHNLTVYAPPVSGENITANNMMSMFVNVQSLEVALFKNVNPWDYQANEEVLSFYGIAYAVFSSSDFGLVDLSSFSKVIIASDQNQAFYDAMDTYRWWFEDYVSNGGVLEIHAADWGWNGGQWVDTLPGGLGWMRYSSNYVTIVDHIHPVVTIPNLITDTELDGWSSSVHGYFSIYPPDARIVIIEDSTGYPAYLEFNYGSGFIVASYQTLEWAYSHGYSVILENSLLYSPIKYQHELAVTLETPTFLEPGESTLLNSTVYNRGLSNETDVELLLLINGIEVESVVIPELPSGSSYTLSHLWTPTVEATYNVTAYAVPVPDENITTNNVYSAFVAVRLAPRILAYVQYSDYSQEYANSLAAIDSTFGPAYVLTELWDYTQLDSMLLGNDVLFIPEQEYSHLYIMEMIGEAWSDTLHQFLEGGGVIIVSDYSGGSHGILTGAGLMSISSANYMTGQTVYLADPTDALASGVSTSFTAPSGTLSFVTDETNVVFDDGIYPVVIHKELGQGHIALIGFDYWASNADTEQILGNAVSLALYIRISLSPSAGSPGTEVTVTGIKAAINGVVEIYWDDTFIGDTIADAFGNFTYLLTVPSDSTAGLHEIRAVDVATGETSSRTFRVIFITIDPISGPIGTKVTVNGAGFSAHSRVPITFDDMQIGYALTDDVWNFTFVFNIPLSDAGLHAVKAWQDLNLVETSFTVVDVTPLEIQMDIGSIFFKGETAEFCVQTCFEGVPVDATFMNVTLCKPDGTVETLIAQRIAAGLFKTEYVITGKGSMVGTYMLVVNASYTTSTVDACGTCIKTFLVKEPYTTLEKEAPRAALVAGSIGTILALAIAWRKRKQLKK